MHPIIHQRADLHLLYHKINVKEHPLLLSVSVMLLKEQSRNGNLKAIQTEVAQIITATAQIITEVSPNHLSKLLLKLPILLLKLSKSFLKLLAI